VSDATTVADLATADARSAILEIAGLTPSAACATATTILDRTLFGPPPT
jgi:hypothetical protein